MFNKLNVLQMQIFVAAFLLLLFSPSFLHAFNDLKDSVVAVSPVDGTAYDRLTPSPLFVRGDYTYPPYEYLDEDGIPRGFNVDIIHAVATAMGIQVNIDLGPWEEVRRQAEAGEVDALIGMFNTPERDRLFDFSIPHLIASYAIFVRDGSSIQSLADAKNAKIIVQMSDLGHDYLRKNGITANIIVKKDWQDVLVSLALGEGDCALVSRLQGAQLIRTLSLENLKSVGPPLIQRKYSIAVPQGSSALLAQINEGLSIIKETGEYDRIYDKWFGVYSDQELSYAKFLGYFFWILLPLVGVVIVAFLFTWTLQKQVKTKTSALNSELLERHRTEEVLRRRENQLQKIFEILPVGLWFADKNGDLGRGNAMGQQIWGVEAEVPFSEYGAIKGCYLPSREPIDADDWALTKTVQEGATIIGELLEIESFDGKRKTILNYTAPLKDDNGDVDGAIVVNLDITQRTALERQLLQSQKMEVVGTLAGGIAHDFNNILTAMLGYSEMAQDDCQPGSDLFNNLHEVLEAGNRAKGLVHQILAFSHRDNAERRLLQPAIIVQETVAMLRPSLPTTIEIKQNIDQISSLIFVNPSQINQVLMNLCTNAFHAMEATGGALDIALKEVNLDDKDFVHAPQITTGKFIQISISDSGAGIDPSIRDKVFEPYFTTKKVGKGTGMGLSIVHGIVKNCGGVITFDSEIGQGTTFHVYIPVAKKNKGVSKQKSDSKVLTGKEHVLFIDDEKALVRMGKNMLEKFGYQVTVHTSSLEALETFRNNPHGYDIVITDQTMPELTGCDLSRKMLEIRPDIPIVLCTGYSTIISEKKAKAIGIKEFALKPLAQRDLAQLIRKVIDVS